MSLANSARITYQGEVLCCFDQTEVKSVEPFLYSKPETKNILKRILQWSSSFLTGKNINGNHDSEVRTKVSFNDGTYIVLKMPFVEFVNSYC